MLGPIPHFFNIGRDDRRDAVNWRINCTIKALRMRAAVNQTSVLVSFVRASRHFQSPQTRLSHIVACPWKKRKR
jgi:hypothetical protein